MYKLVFIVGILLFVACSEEKKEPIAVVTLTEREDKKESIADLRAEYAAIGSVAYLEKYITKVIMEGSTGLGFSAGDMPSATTFSQEDAKEIARFVVTLSGKKATGNLLSNGELYFSGTCGGCHGADAKGGGGSFPDLTKSKFVGIEKREKALRYKIEKLSKSPDKTR